MEVWVSGLGFRVWRSGFRVLGFGYNSFRFRGSAIRGLGCGVSRFRVFEVPGLGIGDSWFGVFEVTEFGFPVSGIRGSGFCRSGFRVCGPGFRVLCYAVRGFAF